MPGHNAPSATEALAIVDTTPSLTRTADADRGHVRVNVSALEAGPGEKGMALDVVSVETRATEFADGTRVRSWTRTEQRVEVVAPEANRVSMEQVALHAPALRALGESSETARLLKLDNDDDYTDDDFDDEDEHDLDLDDDEDDEGDDAAPRLLAAPRSAAPVVNNTSWSPPFTTLRVGSTTISVPDIGAIHGQLCELAASAEIHQQAARDVLRLLEPLAQRAMSLGYGASPDKAALATLRDEARALVAGPLRRAAHAREAATVELEHGQRISQRATGAARVKDKLDALTRAATGAREASLEAERLLRAIEDAAG
jgi:hypothetical protein